MVAARIRQNTFNNHHKPDIPSELMNILTLPHALTPHQDVLNIDCGVPIVRPADCPSVLLVVEFIKPIVG